MWDYNGKRREMGIRTSVFNVWPVGQNENAFFLVSRGGVRLIPLGASTTI
jgi:hypothetical protein